MKIQKGDPVLYDGIRYTAIHQLGIDKFKIGNDDASHYFIVLIEDLIYSFSEGEEVYYCPSNQQKLIVKVRGMSFTNKFINVMYIDPISGKENKFSCLAKELERIPKIANLIELDTFPKSGYCDDATEALGRYLAEKYNQPVSHSCIKNSLYVWNGLGYEITQKCINPYQKYVFKQLIKFIPEFIPITNKKIKYFPETGCCRERSQKLERYLSKHYNQVTSFNLIGYAWDKIDYWPINNLYRDTTYSLSHLEDLIDLEENNNKKTVNFVLPTTEAVNTQENISLDIFSKQAVRLQVSIIQIPIIKNRIKNNL